MPRYLRTLTFVGAAGLLVAALQADAFAQPRTMEAVRSPQPIVVDGIPDEGAWDLAGPATDFVQAEPRQDAPSSERTEVKVLFDNDSLYIGAWCFDRDPSGIIANSLRPDFPANEEDTFEVLLDTFSDSRGGFLFVTNPNGAKRDVQVSAGGDLQNVDWDAVWDVAARITPEGWFVEMRIPFNSLRYNSPLTRPWGLNFGRHIRRHNEVAYWSPVPRRFSITRVSLAGELRGMVGEQLQAGRNLSVKPYVTGRISRSEGGADTTGDAGGDVKYAVTNGLTLDLTVNADFAQVEVDNQIINLDRFSLFFPEKRDFFLENQGIFQIGTQGKAPSSLDPEDAAAFYSRRIGLSARRNPIPILGGARLTGRAGAFQVGLLNLQTGEGDGQGKENSTALRVKRDLFARSEIGAFYLNRQGPERPTNQVYGLDAVLRPRSDLLFNLLHTRTRTPGLDSDDALTRVEVDYNSENLHVLLVQSDVGDNYRNDLGFVKQSGIRASRFEFMPRFRPWSDGLIREIRTRYSVRYLDDQSDVMILRKHTMEGNFVFRDGGSVTLTHRKYFDRLLDDFEIQDNVIIPAGGYSYSDYGAVWSSNSSRMLSGNATLIRGDFWNGDKASFIIGARFRPNARFGAELSLSHDDVELPAGSFTATVSRLRLGYALSTRAFLDAFVQYNSEDGRVATNVRFNVIHRPLSDIFVVFTEDRPTDGTRGARPDISRVLSLKYTHLLAF